MVQPVRKDVLDTLGVLLSFSYKLGLPVLIRSAHLYPVSCDQLLIHVSGLQQVGHGTVSQGWELGIMIVDYT